MKRAKISVMTHHRRDEAWDLNWIKFLPYRLKNIERNKTELNSNNYTIHDDKPHAESRGNDGNNEWRDG